MIIMKDFPLEKYRFYQNGNKIIAIVTEIRANS